MTELKTFLVALYDALSEAELEAFAHGQARMAELAEIESLPDDVSVPVYHATDMNVSLDVGLEIEETERGPEVYMTRPPPEDQSRMTFNVDVFDLIEREDVAGIDPEDVIEELPSQLPATTHRSRTSAHTTEEAPDNESSAEDENAGATTPGRSHQIEFAEPAEGDAEIAAEVAEQPVEAIDAIETSTADILESSGIDTIAELLRRTPGEVAETVEENDESVSRERVATWMRDAQAAVADASSRAQERPIEVIRGIGPAYGQRLREAGIETIADLPDNDPADVAEIVSTDDVTVTPRRTEHWIADAERRLAESEHDSSADDGAANG